MVLAQVGVDPAQVEVVPAQVEVDPSQAEAVLAQVEADLAQVGAVPAQVGGQASVCVRRCGLRPPRPSSSPSAPFLSLFYTFSAMR